MVSWTIFADSELDVPYGVQKCNERFEGGLSPPARRRRRRRRRPASLRNLVELRPVGGVAGSRVPLWRRNPGGVRGWPATHPRWLAIRAPQKPLGIGASSCMRSTKASQSWDRLGDGGDPGAGVFTALGVVRGQGGHGQREQRLAAGHAFVDRQPWTTRTPWGPLPLRQRSKARVTEERSVFHALGHDHP